MDCFAALEIQPTNNSHLIKKAYYRLLLQQLADDISTNNFTALRRQHARAQRYAKSIFEQPVSLRTQVHTNDQKKTSNFYTCSNQSSIIALRKALELEPNNPFILTDIASHYLESNKYRLAIEILTAIQTFHPSHVEAKKLLLNTEHIWFTRQIKRFNNLSSEDIEDLIHHKMRNNQYTQALTLLDKAISLRLNSLHPPTLFKLSAQCMAKLKIDTAPHYFEKSLEHTYQLNENPSEILLCYIEYLFTFRHYDTLLLLVDDLISLDPNQHRSHYLKGEALRKTKRYKQSITSLRYAIGLAPETALYYRLIAEVYRETGHTKKANEYLDAGKNMHKEAFSE